MDADALYALAASPERDSLPPRANAVITPHEREAARLLSCSPEDVRRDRLGAARSLADRWGCAMLKGSGTIVAAREPDLYGRGVFLTPLTPLTSLMEGEPELSVPGSGDVLAGCVGCFMAQGLSPFDAACLGGTLHGIAGRLVRERRGLDGMLASELADALPLAIEVLKSNAAHKGREEFHC
jgi:NAD(P)H-hydrate epimerase